MRWDGKPLKRYCRCCKKRQPLSKYTMNQIGSKNACDDCQRSGLSKKRPARRDRLKKKPRDRSIDGLRKRAEDSVRESEE